MSITPTSNTGLVSFQGVGSGLQVGTIVTALVSPVQRQITPLTDQESALTTINQNYQTLQNDLLDVLAQLSNLSQASTYTANSTSVSAPTVFGATAQASAAVGTSNVNVEQLATNTTVFSQGTVLSSVQGIGTKVNDGTAQTLSNDIGGFADPDIAFQNNGMANTVTTGNFTLNHNGNAQVFTVNASSDSLDSIISKINSAAGLGITATLSGDQITLTSSDGNPIGVGAAQDTSNFLDVTGLSTGTINTGPPYGVTSAGHLGAANISAPITQASTALPDPTVAPTLALQAGGNLTVGDTYEVGTVAYNEVGNLTMLSPTSTITTTAGNQSIQVNYAPTTNASGKGAAGNLIYIRDTTKNTTTYEAINTSNSGGPVIISDYSDGSRTAPLVNSTGGSIAHIYTGTGATPFIPTAGTFSINKGFIKVQAPDPSKPGSGDTIESIIQAINQSSAQVTATYNFGQDTISLSSQTTGATAISLVNGGSNVLSAFNLIGATQAIGKQAKVSVNGESPVFSTSNTVTNAISGVTLNLLATGTGTLTISSNSQPATDSMDALAKSLTQYYKDSASAQQPPVFNKTTLVTTGGPLYNDFYTESIDNNLANFVNTPISGFTGALQPFQNTFDGVKGGTPTSLAGMGLTYHFNLGSAPTFTFDSTFLQNAIAKSPSGIATIMTDSTNGLITKFQNMLQELTNSVPLAEKKRLGITGPTGLASVVAGNENTITSLQSQVTDLNNQIKTLTQLYTTELNAADAQISQNQQTGAALNSLLAQINQASSSAINNLASQAASGG